MKMLRAAATLLALASAASSTLAGEVFSVSVEDASTMSTVSAIADVMNVNLVAWGDPKQRLNLSERDKNAAEILSAFGKAANLAYREAEGVHTLVPLDCIWRPSEIASPVSDEPVSLYFSSIPPIAIMALLTDLQGLRRSKDFADIGQIKQLATVRLKDVPRSSVYRVVSSIFGINLRQLSDGSYRLDVGATSTCGALASQSDVTAALARVIDRHIPATSDRHLPATLAGAEGRLTRPFCGVYFAAVSGLFRPPVFDAGGTFGSR